MASKIELFITIILTVMLRQSLVNTYTYCDTSATNVEYEGNLGQANTFSWLGILRIVLYDRDPKHPDIAATGVVLIKREYALINAHDVSLVPVGRLRSNGRVMFIANTDVPWYCKPKGYTVHPEYGAITQNTVAILELDLSNTTDYPITPICWMSQPLNTSTFLYTVGFTDEHKLLEKIMYKIQYTDQVPCLEFYNRAKLGDRPHTPVYYVCGHAVSLKTHCLWDNGMALISNASEFFSLVGFGVRGPGCAAPARFIDLQYYYDWMEEVTEVRDEYEDYRRVGGIEEVPLHTLYEKKWIFRGDESSGGVKKTGELKHLPYPADVESPRHFNILDDSEYEGITVFPFNNTYESYDNACNAWRILMYREHFELNAEGRVGSAVFKISLYDMLVKRCSCVKIIMDTVSHSSTILSVLEEMDLTEGEAITSSEEMFDNLIKVQPIQELYTKAPNASDKWKPGPNLKPSYLKEYYKSKNIENYNLYIRFGIKDKATMKIEMYGEPFEPGYTTTSENTLRLKDEDVSANLRKQIWIKRPPTQGPRIYQNKFPKTQVPKSGRIKEFPGMRTPVPKTRRIKEFLGARTPVLKSGSVKQFSGNRSKTLFMKSKYNDRAKAKIETMTTKDNLHHLNPMFTGLLPVVPKRPSSSFYNLTRHASYPVRPTGKATPPAFHTRPVHIIHASYPESPPKKATLPTFDIRNHETYESYPTKMTRPTLLYPSIVQVTRPYSNMYDIVRMQTQTFHISTPYPTAFVESESSAARSPRGSVVLIFFKYLCFDLLISLLHF